MLWHRLSSRLIVRRLFGSVLIAGCLLAWHGTQSAPPVVTTAEDSQRKAPASAQEALESFNELIGGWRGIGMPRRGSNVGAWPETAEWVWDFQEKTPAIRYDVEKGQLLKTARLTWDANENQFHLKATLPDDTQRDYTGNLDESNKLVLVSAADDQGVSHRVTVTQLNEKRTLVLFESRTGQAVFRRVAEVGYTRQGTNLAVEGAGELECVVTGGKGTMPVTYQGKTYYVCCSGCKQAFDDDPAGIIAAYEKKVAARKSGARGRGSEARGN